MQLSVRRRCTRDGVAVATREQFQVRGSPTRQRERVLGVLRQLDAPALLRAALGRDRAVAALISLLQAQQPLECAAHLIAPAGRASLFVIIAFAADFTAEHMLRSDRVVATIQDVLVGVWHCTDGPAAAAQEYDIRDEERPRK